MRKKITPYILPVGLYCIIIVMVFGSALSPPSGVLLYGDDIHRAYYFFRQFFNSFLKEGMFPWWNPYIFSGTPFIADPIVNIWYPPTWLFTILPLNIAYSWHIALHVVFAMIGMYVLLRYLSSRPLSSPRWSSGEAGRDPFGKTLDSSFRWNDTHLGPWVGGLIFGLSGFFMARTWAGHVDMIAAASWMPWVIWTNAKCQMTNDKWKKSCIVAGIILAFQLLAGYHTMAFFTLEAVGVLTLFVCFQKRSIFPAFRAFLVLLLAIGLAAIQLIPEMEFVRQSIRSYALPYSWASYGAITWESLKQLISPFYFGDQLTYSGPPPNHIEQSMFIGRVGLGLALIGILGLRKNIFFILVAGFGLWVSLGPNAPIDLQNILWTLIPVYHSLRIPPRHLILFVFGASALTAYGFSFVRPALAKLMVISLIVVEMVGFGRHFIELRPVPETREDKELIAILKKDTQPYRLLQNFGTWIPQRDGLDFDATMSMRIFSANGYNPSMLRSYYDFIDTAAGNKESSILSTDVQVPYFQSYTKALDMLNVKYIMVPRAYDPFVGLKLLREDPVRDYRLYENPSVLPRFYFPDHSAPTIVKYTPNEIILTSDYPTDAILMSSEVYYPGWEASIDGKKTEMIKENYPFRTVLVPARNHTVRFYYRPTAWFLGLAISVFTIIVCFAAGKRAF